MLVVDKKPCVTLNEVAADTIVLFADLLWNGSRFAAEKLDSLATWIYERGE